MNVRYFLFLLFFVCNSLWACVVKDDTGQELQFKQPAKRIISLSPDLTEILFAIGAGNKIVGVVQGSDFPSAAKEIRVVANYHSVDAEAILALQPDLIVAWTETSFTRQLKQLHIPIYYSHQQRILDIPETMQRLACLTGNQLQGKLVAEKFLQHYQKLKEQYSHRPKITVFYQVWSKPLMTITRKSWINEVIELCGGDNIFANLKGTAPEVNVEAVIKADPQVMLGTDLKFWYKWPQLAAVSQHRVYEIDTALIERAGPRILCGAQNLCKTLWNE